jgi:hypothetical protein
MSFKGFYNIITSCCWTFIVILTSPTSYLTFLWTLILPWQSLLVFTLCYLFLMVLYPSSMYFKLVDGPHLCHLLIISWTFSLNYCLNILTFLSSIVQLLFCCCLFSNCCSILTLFQHFLPFFPQLQSYCLFFNHWNPKP